MKAHDGDEIEHRHKGQIGGKVVKQHRKEKNDNEREKGSDLGVWEWRGDLRQLSSLMKGRQSIAHVLVQIGQEGCRDVASTAGQNFTRHEFFQPQTGHGDFGRRSDRFPQRLDFHVTHSTQYWKRSCGVVQGPLHLAVFKAEEEMHQPLCSSSLNV